MLLSNLIVRDKKKQFLSILLILGFTVSLQEAGNLALAQKQPAAAEPATDDEKQKKNTYLDIFHAKTSASNLKGRLLVDIHRLRVMVYNYGDSDEKAATIKLKIITRVG